MHLKIFVFKYSAYETMKDLNRQVGIKKITSKFLQKIKHIKLRVLKKVKTLV